MTIQFRPHHFLCALCFQGKGYSPAFIANFQNIVDQLNTSGDTKIQIVNLTDDICAPCPNRLQEHCEQENKIAALDEAHAKALQIEAGITLSWQDAKNRIKQNISLDQFHQICQSCEWKKLGICETVLEEFLKTH